jgi:hypothetical protein
MASQKYIIVSDCRLDGKALAKGTVIDLDLDDPRESYKVAVLNHAGRIGLATKANIEAIQEELAAEQELNRKAAMTGIARPSQKSS